MNVGVAVDGISVLVGGTKEGVLVTGTSVSGVLDVWLLLAVWVKVGRGVKVTVGTGVGGDVAVGMGIGIGVVLFVADVSIVVDVSSVIGIFSSVAVATDLDSGEVAVFVGVAVTVGEMRKAYIVWESIFQMPQKIPVINKKMVTLITQTRVAPVLVTSSTIRV